MSEEKRPEAPGSGQPNDSSSSSSSSSGGSATVASRQQSDETRRTGNTGAGGMSGGGGGRHSNPRRHRRGGERESQAAPRRQETSINMDELRELADLITAQGFTEFEMEKEGFRLRLSRNTYSPSALQAGASGGTHVVPQPATTITATGASASNAATTAGAEAAAAAAVPGVDGSVNKLTSPIVGTYYRAPSPDAAPYVEVGSRVRKGQVVCIIEAMKLMNEIESEWDGVITEIYPQNGQAVEFGEPLFAIKPE